MSQPEQMDWSELDSKVIEEKDTGLYELDALITPRNNTIPALIVKPATDINPKFEKAVADLDTRVAKLGHGRTWNKKQSDAYKEGMYNIWANHIIVGWQNVYDAKGKLANFEQHFPDWWSRFKKLSTDYFTELMVWCKDPDNFRSDDDEVIVSEPAVDQETKEELLGNPKQEVKTQPIPQKEVSSANASTSNSNQDTQNSKDRSGK